MRNLRVVYNVQYKQSIATVRHLYELYNKEKGRYFWRHVVNSEKQLLPHFCASTNDNNFTVPPWMKTISIPGLFGAKNSQKQNSITLLISSTLSESSVILFFFFSIICTVVLVEVPVMDDVRSELNFPPIFISGIGGIKNVFLLWKAIH